jgi:hypothetical protein
VAAADIPASHLDLLAAVSPPLYKQISRQYARNRIAEDYGSFEYSSIEHVQVFGSLQLHGLCRVFDVREQLMRASFAEAGSAAASADISSSSSSSGSSSSSSSAAGPSRAVPTLVPRQQQLLPPLLLTLAEFALLLPDLNMAVVPLVMLPIAQGMQHLTHGTPCNQAALEAKVDALTAPVLLQLGPVVLQYVRKGAAAAAAAGVQHSTWGRAADNGDLSSAAGCLAFAAVNILRTGVTCTPCLQSDAV